MSAASDEWLAQARAELIASGLFTAAELAPRHYSEVAKDRAELRASFQRRAVTAVQRYPTKCVGLAKLFGVAYQTLRYLWPKALKQGQEREAEPETRAEAPAQPQAAVAEEARPSPEEAPKEAEPEAQPTKPTKTRDVADLRERLLADAVFTEEELSAQYYMRTFRYHTDASVERRSYRERAVRACTDGYGSMAKVAALLGVNAVTLKRWRTDLDSAVATHSTSDSAPQAAEDAPANERFVVSSASLAGLLADTVQDGEGDDELLRRIASASVVALLQSGEFADAQGVKERPAVSGKRKVSAASLAADAAEKTAKAPLIEE